MKAAHLFAAFTTILLLITTNAWAQDRDDRRFNDRDRQIAREWYEHHRAHAPRGLRPVDRLPPEWELRLQAGRPFDRDWERRSYSIPRDLRRRLPPIPWGYKYVVVGDHVVLVDRHDHIIRDVIHLHD